MNFIEEMIKIVNTTPLSKMAIDMNNVVNIIDVEKLYSDFKSQPENRIFMDSLTFMYQDSVKRGIEPVMATAVVIKVYDIMLRSAVAGEIKKKLESIGADDMTALRGSNGYNELMQRIKEATEAVSKINSDAIEAVKNLPLIQFKYSLSYAVEKWGNTTEKRAVKNLIKKIKLNPQESITKSGKDTI